MQRDYYVIDLILFLHIMDMGKGRKKKVRVSVPERIEKAISERRGNTMLRLRPYKRCDAERIVSWIKDERTFRQWCADRYESYPITADDMNAHYDANAFSDGFFEMTAFDETGITGHLIMRFTDEGKKILRFGFVIVDDAKRGKGYGKQMLELAIKYAFEILMVDKITIGVFENNESAYRCYLSVGFQDTGQTENCTILGENWKCRELALER